MVGASHMTRCQALEEDATNPLLTTDLLHGRMEKKEGQEETACKLGVGDEVQL